MTEIVQIKGNYLQSLKNAQPTVHTITTQPPKGSMSSPSTVHHELPPINTDIQFSSVLPVFKHSEHQGLSAMDARHIPDIFDWRHDYSTDNMGIRRKKTLITKPGNQALCGSCWAISGAGIISDNFVVSDVVDWVPNLSTTWSLMAYPQNQCKGGNPAVLFNDVAKGGITSDHCVDYSWCIENDICNGSALKHFDASKQASAIGSLNSLIPKSPGCYYSNGEHYLYYIDPNPKTIFIGSPGVTKNNIVLTVKKQIFTKGPVMGGFIVYKNFMPGTFTKSSSEVYFEDATYNSEGNITDWKNPKEWAGSHAISIVGWGVAKNTQYKNKRENVPYWYCRNSWKDTWGDGGYFKMAMYPWNKISQFESQVTVADEQGNKHIGGGIVFIQASKKPKKKTLPQLQTHFANTKKIHKKSYYTSDPKIRPPVPSRSTHKRIFVIVFVISFVVGLFFLILWFISNHVTFKGRSASYRML
jgi:hypothetical protein